MVLLKESVLIISSVLVVWWLLVSHHQAQQALVWWYSKQWMRMCEKGETIRNGLLQESFIIRRHLELSSVNRSESQQQDQYYLLMQEHPTLNIVVQTAESRALKRLKPAISLHEGGFTVADKSLPMNEMLNKVKWALDGVFYTPLEMRSGLEVKPEWLEVLS
ncbi:hypothetical protein [Scytonema sp. UIC 10036]|uniref:hypothetical protein n=1 Tax=Scytonema sp. UIC 10036 TaxID=2304196 RepID=UPI001FAACA4F|nr:hypothetical protein [Scytonema sp. UIC 10036]